MAHAQELLDNASRGVSASQVFGEPVERDGVTVIPVARVLGGGGGGYGNNEGGVGSGYGVRAEPVGAYVISEGRVKWEPAVNVNKIVTGSFLVGIAWALASPRIAKHTAKWMKRR